jgi:SAM-dependent methyltransferase
MNGYRRRILREMLPVMTGLQPLGRVLDVGAGDGWFAKSIEGIGICDAVTAVDVKVRQNSHHHVQLYDGIRLPFQDAAYDLVYAIDVVHHAIDPRALLSEMVRCTRRYLLLKDHTWRTRLGWMTLAALDEIGNRRFGVRCVYKFQHRWEWDTILQARGLRRVRLRYPLGCHIGPLGRFPNRLEFLSLWELA